MAADMTKPEPNRVSILIALAALALEVVHLAIEHLGGGVKSHHLLNRSDLPVFSNWWGLVVLPLLGWVLGMRIRHHAASSGRPGLSVGLWIGLAGSFLYGATLAASFMLGASTISAGLFFGLLALGAALPIYRAECIFGFVVGMTFTFGAVLPCLVAGVLALISFVVRLAFQAAVGMVRRLISTSGRR